MQDLRIYQDLPPALAMRLAITVHRRILSRCPALCALSDDALLGVLGRLKPRIYIPKQVIIIEGQEHKAIMFVKKGKILMLKAMGTAEEALVRVVGQYDNFGLSLSNARSEIHAVSGRSSATEGFNDFHVANQLNRPMQTATESARAETYCDVISLDRNDLTTLFTKDRLWSKLSQAKRPPAAMAPAAAEPTRAVATAGRSCAARRGARVQPAVRSSTNNEPCICSSPRAPTTPVGAPAPQPVVVGASDAHRVLGSLISP
jgi:CRP-like cAMP-binding protein